MAAANARVAVIIFSASAGSSQGEVALAVGLIRVPEQPECMGEAQPHQQLRILPVAQHVRPAAFGPEPRHRGLEVAARPGQPPGPVRGDTLQAVAFHPQDLIVVPLGAGP